MNFVEFLQKRFGFDAMAEFSEKDNPVGSEKDEKNTPSHDEEKKEENISTVETKNNSEVDSLKARIAELETANAKLAAGKSLDNRDSKNIEEILYSLYLGGNENGNKDK